VAGRQQKNPGFLQQGALFERRYRIVRELGRGGFGTVYLAYQEQMDRHVAIKVLKSGIGDLHHSAKERFLREVKIISKLRHPNTVTIHDFGETAQGVLYMVLEFVEGKTVKQIIRRDGALQPQRALALSSQIARSLAEAHRHGVIHRDLKPDNIMVTDLETEADFVKVLDFGIARLLRTDERDLTSVGLPEGERELIGTPRYMSPEQVRGQSLGPASDVYSVGLILYEMMIGQPAVQGDTTMALISQQISPEPLRLEGLRALPPRISEVIRKATTKDMTQRYHNAEAFIEALEQALASVGGPLPGTASARETGRFQSVDRSNVGADPTVTPNRGLQTGQFGPAQTTAPRAQPGQAGQAGRPGQTGRVAPVSRQSQHSAGSPGPGGHAPPSPAPHPGGAEFTGNEIYQFSEEPEESYDEQLPPPPGDTNPFAVPNPSAQSSDQHDPEPLADEEPSSLEFVGAFLRMGIFGMIALIGLYVAFLVTSAIFGHFLSGSLKLMASLILSAAIPLLTALGENSKRERFDVVDDPYDRVVRVFVGTSIFSFGTAVLCALVMSGGVVHELRSFPNWFLNDSQRRSAAGELNASVSLGLAQVIEESTRAIGIYSGKGHTDTNRSGERRFKAKPPEPTRPSTRAQRQLGAQQGDSEDASQDAGSSDAKAAGEQQPDTPAPSQPKPDDDSDEYIRW
jgi:eukaryotic-like serine/threonine-protein kinase